jgi:dolichyl-phosphate-mannose-protein mannosyltransferase
MKRLLPIVMLSAVLTGSNAVKPLHVDDATFYFNAAQIASNPLDPYGYVMLRWSDAVPALHALAPPVLPYWWAAAIRMFGDRPVLWKLGCFPFALIFVASLAALLRRFAPSVAMPLLVMLVLSPVFLPSLNLMMDIPALALSLLALVLFFRACDHNSLSLAVFAGLIAGFAIQTKYTGFLAPSIVLIYALLHRKMHLGMTAALSAGSVFVAWETALFFRYGESHFVYQLFQGDNGDQPKTLLLASIFPLLGGAAPTLALLALTVLPAPRWLLFLAVLIAALPFLLLVCPDAFSGGGEVYQLVDALFACNGGVVLLSVGWVARRLVAASEPLAHSKCDSKRDAWFLALWFALELAGYVVISPFPAVRRIMGTTIAATLLIGCLAGQSRLETWRRNVLHGLVAVTVLPGLGFFIVDYLEARAEHQAAYAADQLIHREHPQATIWYAGYWGFQYYAEKCGMKQIVPLRITEDGAPALLPASHLHREDWLVIPDEGIPQQELDLDRPELEPEGKIAVGDSVPLATLMNYYAGAVPLRHHSGPRIILHLFRLKSDFVAR